MTPPLTKIACALALLSAGTSLSRAGGAEAPDPLLSKATDSISRQQGIAAATLLERELPRASGERKAKILALLEKAYQAAEKECTAKGQARRAKSYRENAALIRQLRAKQAPAAAPASTPSAEVPPAETSPAAPAASLPPMAATPPSEPDPVPDPLAALIESPKESEPTPGTGLLPEQAPVAVEDTAQVVIPNEPTAEGDPNQGAMAPSPAPAAPPQSSGESLPAREPASAAPAAAATNSGDEPKAPSASPTGGMLQRADEAFAAQDYSKAGQIYGEMFQNGALPRERHDHWAYCRMAAVTQQINAGPASRGEWIAIEQEIEAIRGLSPNNWFAQYLKDLADERKGLKPKGSARVDSAISRASAEIAQKPNTPSTGAAAAAAAPVGRAGAPTGDWQTWESTNFRVIHQDEALARKVAAIAEDARGKQFQRWSGQEAQAEWQPRCEIRLYPTSDAFAQATKQPPTSPGFSTMSSAAGKIAGRQIHLRADDAKLLDVHLPHEITHVVIADFFPNKPLARWADEGIAVMSEPDSEQAGYFGKASQLMGGAGQPAFTAKRLMETENPNGAEWVEFYAKSASLTRFFLDRGTPVQFLRFLQAAQGQGWEKELRESYGIGSFEDLQSLWEARAKGES